MEEIKFQETQEDETSLLRKNIDQAIQIVVLNNEDKQIDEIEEVQNTNTDFNSITNQSVEISGENLNANNLSEFLRQEELDVNNQILAGETIITSLGQTRTVWFFENYYIFYLLICTISINEKYIQLIFLFNAISCIFSLFLTLMKLKKACKVVNYIIHLFSLIFFIYFTVTSEILVSNLVLAKNLVDFVNQSFVIIMFFVSCLTFSLISNHSFRNKKRYFILTIYILFSIVTYVLLKPLNALNIVTLLFFFVIYNFEVYIYRNKIYRRLSLEFSMSFISICLFSLYYTIIIVEGTYKLSSGEMV